MSTLSPLLIQQTFFYKNAWDEDPEDTNQYLKKGKIRKALCAEQESDYTTYFLVESPYFEFNSVMFEPIGWEEWYDLD